ncbi:MAG: N-6 DNA methylase [Gammaproteobacteria bacterium]|nr:N-6 DNA methylase [Gammaproteobacteria bacterium]
MSEPTIDQISYAEGVLRYPKGKPEDHVRKQIGLFLASLGIEFELSYPTGSGPADIYLPRRRIIIETKQAGKADHPNRRQSRQNPESPKQQLERYLRAEIADELHSGSSDEGMDTPWTDILTDGKVWHVWRYPHEEDAVGVSVLKDWRPETAQALVQRLKPLLEVDPIGKPWIPANPRSVFEPRLERLREIHAALPHSAKKPTETKRRLWLEMLRTSSMEPDNEAARQRLFVAHSFLVALARGVIHVLANPDRVPQAKEILGEGFVAWIVETVAGRQWADQLFKEIHGYEWRRRRGDVLRPLYEQFVDERDRKAFGEYYTPDWLAEWLVGKICDEAWCEMAIKETLVARRQRADLQGVGVLDPACGSGTFLFHASTQLLRSKAMAGLAEPERASVVCALVHGIDVHPVAAEISRATLLRALPATPPHGAAELNIHEGDSLLIRGDDENSLFRPANGDIRIETPKGAEIFLPRSFIERSHFPDDLRRLVLAATHNSELPPDLLEGISDEDRQTIQNCHRRFVEIIEDEGNSVWTWYIRNIMGPYRLSEKKINRIVANPPWVKMANIQAESRKRALEKFTAGTDMALWSGGRHAPDLDIAQLFIKRARQLYLADPGIDPSGWLVKKAAIKAGNWEKFREWHQTVLVQTVDLEALRPFGGGDARRCCVLFDGRPVNLPRKNKKHLVAEIKGSSPKPDARLEEVEGRLSLRPAPRSLDIVASDYVDAKGRPLFRQGATITPKVLVILERVETQGRRNRVTTARSQHKPWSTIAPQVGTVPSHWVRNLTVSKSILPFAPSPVGLVQALMPTNADGALDRNAVETSEFWQSLDKIYREQRGRAKFAPKTLLSQIDYNSKLSAQLETSGKPRSMVVYPKSGDIMRACRLRPEEPIIDFTLYRFSASSAQEAAYLVALLNAPCLNDAYVQCRKSGRDFCQHPWRSIPIRRYDGKNPDHVELARLAAKAERTISTWLTNLPSNELNSLGQVGLSARARGLLLEKKILEEIDCIARNLLPDHARS